MALLEKAGFHQIVCYPARLLDAFKADLLLDASVAERQRLILSKKCCDAFAARAWHRVYLRLRLARARFADDFRTACARMPSLNSRRICNRESLDCARNRFDNLIPLCIWRANSMYGVMDRVRPRRGIVP